MVNIKLKYNFVETPRNRFAIIYLRRVSTKLYFNLKYNFVETPRKCITAKLSIHKLGSSSVLIKKIRAYGSNSLG